MAARGSISVRIATAVGGVVALRLSTLLSMRSLPMPMMYAVESMVAVTSTSKTSSTLRPVRLTLPRYQPVPESVIVTIDAVLAPLT